MFGLSLALMLSGQACKKPTNEAPASSGRDALPLVEAQPVPSRPTIAASVNELGWKVLRSRSGGPRALVAPFSLSRALLRRASHEGAETAEALRARLFGGRPTAELTLGVENLHAAFVRHTSANSIRLRLDGEGQIGAQSQLLEFELKPHWHQRFERDRTAAGTFQGSGGPEAGVPFMVQSAQLPSTEDRRYVLLELPFQDERLSMLVWTPKAELGFSELVSMVAESRGELGVSALAPRRVALEFPKFRVEDQLELGPVLTSLGLEEGTTSSAEGALSLDLAQRVSLEVDEDGTAGPDGGPAVVGFRPVGPPPMAIEVDRPFLFAVRDRPSGTMLLIGRVESLLP